MSSPPPTHLDWNTIEFVVLDMDGTLLDLHFDNQVWNVLLPKRYGEKYALEESIAHARISEQMNP